MATKQKLVFANQGYAALTKAADESGKNAGILVGKWEESGNDFYHSVIFTNDGYILTHGHIFKTISGDVAGVTMSASGNIISLAGQGSGSVTITGGNLLTASTNNNEITIDHNTSGVTVGSYGQSTTSTSASSVTVPYLTIDAYGHITAVSNNSVTLDLVKDAAIDNSKTMYLLGHEDQSSTATTLSKSTIKVTTDANGNATLYAPALNISGGVSAITIGSSDPKTLDKYIENAVADAKTLAMTFKGTFAADSTAAFPASSPVNGDTYKVSSAGKAKLTDSTTVDVKIGDVLVAKVTTSGSTTTTEWVLIPAGDETETFITVSSSDLSNSTYTRASSEVTLGNAALRIVGSVADNNTGLVTGDAVYDAITGHAGIDKVGTVTTVGLATDSGLEISNAVAGTYGTSELTVTAYLRNKLLSYDKNSNKSTLTGSRLYPVLLDNNGNLAVNVPQVYSMIVADDNTDTSNEEKSAAAQTLYFNLLDGATSTKSVAGYFGLAASTGLTIASNNGVATLTANVSNASATYTGTSAGASGDYTIGTITVNGGTVTFKGHDNNTWRPVNAYIVNTSTHKALNLVSNTLTDIENSTTDNIEEWLATSTGTDDLAFSSTFSINSNKEVDIIWAEISDTGVITYEF